MTDHVADTPLDDRDARQREEQLLREHRMDSDDPRLDQEIRRLEEPVRRARSPNSASGEPILQRSAFRTAFQAPSAFCSSSSRSGPRSRHFGALLVVVAFRTALQAPLAFCSSWWRGRCYWSTTWS
ncbi:MAG TPA: hypothetical protein VK923_11750 [Euzebyales bacterium]|nr:hypothetical protein [Euzebyales bacterium]